MQGGSLKKGLTEEKNVTAVWEMASAIVRGGWGSEKATGEGGRGLLGD